MQEQQDAFSRALQSTTIGDHAAALKEFLWLHDNPDRESLPSEMFRRVYGFQAWATLGLEYPPAKEKMCELLKQKIAYLKLHPADKFVWADAGAMKEALELYGASPAAS